MTGKELTIILSQGGTAIAATRIRSNDLQANASPIEVASATQQDWKEFIAGRKEWSLTINYLILAKAQVQDLLYVGQAFGITAQADDVQVSGTAIMTAVRQTATIGNLAQGSYTLKGSGALS